MQKSNHLKSIRAAVAVAALGVVCLSSSLAAPTNRFGFTGPEIFPIDSQISLLRSADLNGDGLNDLIVVNFSRSKIDLLYAIAGAVTPDDLDRYVGADP